MVFENVFLNNSMKAVTLVFFQEYMVSLGSLLKDEGNALFKEGEFQLAVELYSVDIVLYRNVLMLSNTSARQQAASVLLANRAFCFIKLVRV